MPEEQVTTEEAVRLARCFVRERPPEPDEDPMYARLLVDTERERLFAWVRGTMESWDPSLPTATREDLAELVGQTLGWGGWGNDGREPVTGMRDAPDEMEAWFAEAWALCEAAGWPS